MEVIIQVMNLNCDYELYGPYSGDQKAIEALVADGWEIVDGAWSKTIGEEEITAEIQKLNDPVELHKAAPLLAGTEQTDT